MYSNRSNSEGSATVNTAMQKIGDATMSRKFEEQVAKMRTLQKEYLRTRNALTLAAAKKAEKDVDDTLTRKIPCYKPAADDAHPKLFEI